MISLPFSDGTRLDFGARSYAEAARVVWTGARRGREAARKGHRSVAFACAEPLRYAIGPERLQRLAREAAIDIEQILAGETLAWTEAEIVDLVPIIAHRKMAMLKGAA